MAFYIYPGVHEYGTELIHKRGACTYCLVCLYCRNVELLNQRGLIPDSTRAVSMCSSRIHERSESSFSEMKSWQPAFFSWSLPPMRMILYALQLSLRLYSVDSLFRTVCHLIFPNKTTPRDGGSGVHKVWAMYCIGLHRASVEVPR